MLAGRTKNSCSIFCKTLRISAAKRFMNKLNSIHTVFHVGYDKFEQVCMRKNDVFKHRF